MKVLVISPGQDNGGIGYAIKQAFDRNPQPYGGVQVRSVRTSNNYIDFRADITARKLDEELLPLFEWADLIHMMEYFAAIEWAPGWERKPRLIHHHSATARQAIIDRAKDEDIIQISALPTVALQDEAIEWVPNPCDTDYLGTLDRSGQDRLLISQSPSGRAKNGTQYLIDAFDTVKDRADLDIIEGLPWTECMDRKAAADVGFDSFTTGYGISGVEYMAMGIPLITGAIDPRVESLIKQKAGCSLPYYPATPESLPDALAEMVDFPNLRLMFGVAGRDYARQVHGERVVAANLRSVYERVMEKTYV